MWQNLDLCYLFDRLIVRALGTGPEQVLAVIGFLLLLLLLFIG